MDRILTATPCFKGERGFSAYEIAVQNGFKGSKEAWLEQIGFEEINAKLPANVKDFGAVGDGVTDDTAVIQYVLDNYDTVHFPKGEYLLKTGLEIKKSNTIIRGDNATLNYQGDDYFINVNTQITRFKMEDFNIKGNNVNSCFNFNNGIVDSSINNVRVENFNIGLHSTYSWCVSVMNLRIHNCVRPLDLISQSNNFNFINCSFSAFSSQNILTNAEGVAFIGCNITNNETTKAIKLFQSSLTLINCYFEKLYSDYTIECGNNNEQLESVLTIDGGNITDKYISIIGNNSYIKFSNLRKGKIKIKEVWDESDQPSIGSPIKSLEMPSNYKGTRCNSHTFFDEGVDYTFSRYGSGITLTQELVNGIKQLTISDNTEGTSGGFQIQNLEVGKEYILEIEGKTPENTTLLFQQSGVGYGVNIALTGERLFIPFTAFASNLRVRWTHTDTIELSAFKIYEI